MFLKKKMLLKSLKSVKKPMQYYQMRIRENSTINSDIVHLLMLKVASQDLMALTLVTMVISWKKYLKTLALEQVHLEAQKENKPVVIYYTE